MTDKTYTEDDIRKAIEAGIRRADCNKNIVAEALAELNKPKPSFREGEVVGFRTHGGSHGFYEYRAGGSYTSTLRPLKISELPGYVHDLAEVVEKIAAESESKIPSGNGWTYTYSEMAAKALDAYHKAGGEG